jgi:hypothetical protein
MLRCGGKEASCGEVVHVERGDAGEGGGGDGSSGVFSLNFKTQFSGRHDVTLFYNCWRQLIYLYHILFTLINICGIGCQKKYIYYSLLNFGDFMI